MQNSHRIDNKNDKTFTIVFVILVTVVFIVFVADRKKIIEVFSYADWKKFAVGVVFTFLSYFWCSCAIIQSNKLFNINVNFFYQTIVNFVTISIGNLMDWGGIAGYSLRAVLLNKKGVNFSRSFGSSIYFSYFNFLVLILSLPFGIIGLQLIGEINPSNRKIFYTAAVLAVCGSSIAASVIFVKKNRVFLIESLNRLVKKLFKKDWSDSLLNFDRSVTEGVANIRLKKLEFAKMIGFTILEWICSLAALWTCFTALSIKISLFELMTGFAAGIVITTFSFVPGGIGVQEGSMAGVLSLLGVKFSLGVIVTFAFRIVYYFIPSLVSLIIYWFFLAKVAKGKNS